MPCFERKAEHLINNSINQHSFLEYILMNVNDQNSHLKSDDNVNDPVVSHGQAQVTNMRVDSKPSSFLFEREESDHSDSEECGSKKMKRILANRKSARESYQRRKRMFSELETTVTTLTKSNTELMRENQSLRQEIMALRQQLGVSNAINTRMGDNMDRVATLPLSNHQFRTVASHPVPFQDTRVNQVQQMGIPPQDQNFLQQQGDLDQLLDLILRGRQA
jgi:bZIP transcription factor